ncbi:hypothetical protein [Methylorubrum extorquens]|uniref:hypothetical protein n=1 Tax=Methylorubrum extorquens TaxID=408 RepID=UPI001EE5477C|nr:hypothetical protein [Methylorubrum extorquens]MCG5249617.1 hypothetical protein [Methylorubrum extorquens]
MLSLSLGGCSLLEESVATPWMAYAKMPQYNRTGWVWNGRHATYRDCMERAEYDIDNQTINGKGSARPFGCMYTGNNYWLSWYYYLTLAKDEDFECLAKQPGLKAIGEYSPVTKGAPRKTADYYCL